MNTNLTVPLAALVVSPLNARAHDDGKNDPELQGMADSIAAAGLIHALVVHDMGGGKFGTLCGRRRLLAMRLLDEVDFEKGARIDPEAIPCSLAEGTDDELRQISLAENMQRQPMTDIDLFRAIQAIFADNAKNPTDEMLAQAFGTTVTRIKRLVRLSHVHPTIMEAFVAEQLEMDELEIFAKSSDQVEQLAVYEAYANDEISQWQLEKAMGFNDDEVRYRLAFVGPDDYAAAGGRLEQDLFDDDENAAVKVLDPPILEQLLGEKLAGMQAAITARYPDREITFTDQPRKGSDGYVDYNLRAHLSHTDETKAALAAGDKEQRALLAEFGVLDGKKYEPYQMNHLVQSTGKGVGLKGAQAKQWDKAVATLVESRQREKALEKADKLVPEKATICQFVFGRNGVSVEWWYPDRQAAGQTDKPTSANPAASAPKPGEEGYDPNRPPLTNRAVDHIRAMRVNPAASAPKPGEEGYDPNRPPLTNRAVDHIRAMRVNMAARHVQGDDSRHRETADLAHKALIFALGWKLANPHQFGETVGLVIGFAGDKYSFPGTSLEPVDAPAIPGLREKEALAGFKLFAKKATPKEVDQLAAWVFTRKIDPSGSKSSTIVDEIFGHKAALGEAGDARTAVTPDLDDAFFGLFPKKVLGSFLGTFDTDQEKAVLNAKGDQPVKLTVQGIGKAEVGSPAWKWLPTALRWGK